MPAVLNVELRLITDTNPELNEVPVVVIVVPFITKSTALVIVDTVAVLLTGAHFSLQPLLPT